MRLNKRIAESGFCSRRDADRLISEGKVTVNGRIAQLGDTAEEADEICVCGKVLSAEAPCMLAFYKPVGVVSSEKHRDRAVTYYDYLKLRTHLFPVGRLDKDSEGLLLLTNLGDLSERIQRAGELHEKEYLVTVDRELSGDFPARMANGVRIRIPANRSTTGKEEVYLTRKCSVQRTGADSFRIILTEGKNRQIRRMCEALGYRVKRLVRVRIMNISLDGLQPGETRYLSEEEISELERSL